MATGLSITDLVSGKAKAGSNNKVFPNYGTNKPLSPVVAVHKAYNTGAPAKKTITRTTNTGSTSDRKSTTSGGSGNGGKTTTTNTGSGSGSSVSSGTAQARKDYANLKKTTLGSISDLTKNTALEYGSSLQDWMDTYKQQQTGINTEQQNNELSKIQGSRDVLDMVGNGIRSGGVTLNNNNAANSSASDEIAKAYGRIGAKQQAGVNNTYEENANSIGQEQSDLALSQKQQVRHAGETKQTSINGIIQQAVTQLGNLNQSAAFASLPDRVDIEKQKASIRANALAALAAYDHYLTDAVKKNPASNKNQNYAAALKLANAGNDTGSQFDYTSSIPSQLAGTGPYSSPLPIFTYGG